jgi:hypothetical protein
VTKYYYIHTLLSWINISMASFLNGFLDNVVSGALNPGGNLADFQHAARMFVDDNHRLSPKVKFLYHVSFSINPSAASIIPQLTQKHGTEIGMLVKTAQLPAYQIQTDVKHQYNRKKVVQKRIDYSPVTLTFHDDNFGVSTALWEAYYRYYYRDGNYAKVGPAGNPEPINEQYPTNGLISLGGKQYRYGFDNDSLVPFFNNITIYQLSRKRYTAFTLVNPIISQWQHDTMDYSASDVVESSMTLEYETVHYSRGSMKNPPKGFGDVHYDKTPSPNSLAGGGASSLLGVGGVLAGGFGVLDDISGGNVSFGTVLKAANTIQNAKGLSSAGVGQELLGSAISAVGQSQGIDVSGVAGVAFPKGGGGGGLGNIVAAGIAVGAANAVANAGADANSPPGPGGQEDE